MKVCLINPPLIGYRGDPFGHIPSIPVGLLYVAAAARAAGHEVSVLDAFGLASKTKTRWLSGYELVGLSPYRAAELIPPDTEVVGISAHSGACDSWVRSLLSLSAPAKWKRVVGGSFAGSTGNRFIKAGADYVVVGEGEASFAELLESIDKGADPPEGVLTNRSYTPRPAMIQDLDQLPYPAYDLIDLKPYFSAGRAHGPWRGPYLPLITSRGCPYKCAFCATPLLSGGKWRARSADNVFEEIGYLQERHGVRDFHIQDDNFTTSERRVRDICARLADLGRPARFSLPSAVKVENVTVPLLETMAAAGLEYISFSPESGSEKVLSLMNKRFDFGRLFELIEAARRLGVKTQACFVLGFPGETDEDRDKTAQVFRRLMAIGVDDVSFFIFAPVPGSASEGSMGPTPEYEGMNWSPRWREDYRSLDDYRSARYREYFLLKARHHPVDLIKMAHEVFLGRYSAKGSMALGWLARNYFTKAISSDVYAK